MPPRGAAPFTTRHVYTEQWQVLLHSKSNQMSSLFGRTQVALQGASQPSCANLMENIVGTQ